MKEQYDIVSSHIVIYDEELGIAFHDPEPLIMSESTTEVNHGVVRMYDKDKTILSECYYIKGILHGPSRWYFSNGKIASVSWYIHGIKEGKSYTYYENGALSSIQRFVNGIKEGVHEYYYQTGILKTKIFYTNDKMTKEVKLYYPNGKKMRTISVKDGKRDGMDILYDSKEQIFFSLEYSKGKYVEAKVKDPLSSDIE